MYTLKSATPSRFVLAAAPALLVAFALQILMQSLIASDQRLPPPSVEIRPGELFVMPAEPPPRTPVIVTPPTLVAEPPDYRGVIAVPPLLPEPPVQANIDRFAMGDTRPGPPIDLPFGHGLFLPDSAARMVSVLRPQYPERARRAGRTGQVTVVFTVGRDGRTGDYRIVQVEPRGYDFDKAVLRAMRDARFAPALRNGEAVTSRHRQRFSFTLD